MLKGGGTFLSCDKHAANTLGKERIPADQSWGYSHDGGECSQLEQLSWQQVHQEAEKGSGCTWPASFFPTSSSRTQQIQGQSLFILLGNDFKTHPELCLLGILIQLSWKWRATSITTVVFEWTINRRKIKKTLLEKHIF